ncbi:MAG: alpha/beta fold hydrolase [Solirubrobacteraceae bacterium]
MVARSRIPARRPAVLGAGAALLLAACGGGGGGGAQTATTAAAGPRPAAPRPRLADSRPCTDAPGFTCATLRVPLDRSGRVPGTLALQVATAGRADAPRTLVYLSGGPGQPGVPFGPQARARLRPALGDYRLVLIDQRGTGGGALDCPRLQAEVGTSDLTVPSRGAVADCARRLGARRAFFSTAHTVADLEDLRAALGAPKLALDGVSYGTFVAERYAIAHPDRVDRLVLDSVVPAAGLTGLEDDGMRRSAQVLRGSAADLAAVVRRERDGPALLDTIVALSVEAPSFPGVASALRAARQGDAAPLHRLIAAVHRAQLAPRRFFSAGLHAATLCADLRAPWGDARAPLAGRAAAVGRAAAHTDPGPFDRATIMGNGLIRTCELWPPTPVRAPAGNGALPPVPALLLAGDHDLSTPLPWPRRQLAATPRGHLILVRGAGHSVQSRARDPAVRRAVIRFLRARGQSA